jgi:hypothetical protein
MPEVADPPPKEVVTDLAGLHSEPDDQERGVPVKALDRNLLIASWTVRTIGHLTKKWETTSGHFPSWSPDGAQIAYTAYFDERP